MARTLSDHVIDSHAVDDDPHATYRRVRIDALLGHDATTALLIDEFERRKLTIWDRERVLLTNDHFSPPATIERADAYRKLQESRIERMRAYAETRRCRRQFLLEYFGEQTAELCGDCDNCLAGVATNEPDAGPFRVEQPVRHPAFGTGVVMGVEGDEITVLFDDVGYKTLSLPTVVEQELLTPA